jgi:hypothetical protein
VKETFSAMAAQGGGREEEARARKEMGGATVGDKHAIAVGVDLVAFSGSNRHNMLKTAG